MLAVGVAHDVRNLLFVVTTRSHHLLQALGDEHPLRPDVEAIREATERASVLARQVLAAGSGTAVQSRPADLNTVVNDCRSLLTRLCGDDIEVSVQLADAVWPVALTPTQLEQILINLVTNARDAMSGRGRLSIVTEAGADREARLIVRDTGRGMDAVVQARMFEPFFTTRAESGGTGVGLATVHGVVARAGGRVDVQSEVGEGTTITITLPAVRQAAASTPRAPVVRPAARDAAGGRILVIDDEPGVRELLQQCLRSQGYAPVMAESGDAARQQWQQQKGAFDLVICDVSLPDVDGPELAAGFRRDRTDLELIFVSGAIDAAARVARVGLQSPTLTKPFSMVEFVRLTKAALCQASAA